MGRVEAQKLNEKRDRGHEPSPAELAFMRAFVSGSYWKSAKTYEEWAPHTYTVNPSQRGADARDFWRFLSLINKCGYTRNFFSKVFRYIDLDGETFWVCGVGLTDSGIINRAKQSDEEVPWPPPR